MVDMLNGRFTREGAVVLMVRAWIGDIRFFIDNE